MGRQIQIAQDKVDEAAMIKQISKRYPDVFSSQRLMDSPRLGSHPWGSLQSQSQILYLKAAFSLLEQRVIPQVGGPSWLIHPEASHLLIEWSRTKELDKGNYEARSRIYLKSNHAWPELFKSTLQLFEAMRRWIVSRSPSIIKDGDKYVGESLTSRIQSGDARLFHPSGKPVVLVANPKFRPER